MTGTWGGQDFVIFRAKKCRELRRIRARLDGDKPQVHPGEAFDEFADYKGDKRA
jgi:hypothetical protein